MFVGRFAQAFALFRVLEFVLRMTLSVIAIDIPVTFASRYHCDRDTNQEDWYAFACYGGDRCRDNR